MQEPIQEGEQVLVSTEDNSRKTGGCGLRNNGRIDNSF